MVVAGSDKVRENELVMMRISNNTPEQAMFGGFVKAVDDAVMGSNEAHQNQMMQLLSDPAKAKGFARVVFDLLQGGGQGRSVAFRERLACSRSN